jgi:molecular chaperone DnaK
LQTASHKLAEVLYSQTANAPTEEQASSASAGADSTSSSNSDDNVIDAEYVDVEEDKK